MFGGVSILVILKAVVEPLRTKFPILPSSILDEYLILFCAGVGYVISELFILPYCRRRVTEEMIKNDRDRDVYFRHYIEMSRRVLKGLLDEAVEIYNACYAPEKYPEIEPSKKNELLDLILPKPVTCPHITECKVGKGKEIDDKNWVICETVVAYKKCPIFIDKEKKAHS